MNWIKIEMTLREIRGHLFRTLFPPALEADFLAIGGDHVLTVHPCRPLSTRRVWVVDLWVPQENSGTNSEEHGTVQMVDVDGRRRRDTAGAAGTTGAAGTWRRHWRVVSLAWHGFVLLLKHASFFKMRNEIEEGLPVLSFFVLDNNNGTAYIEKYWL